MINRGAATVGESDFCLGTDMSGGGFFVSNEPEPDLPQIWWLAYRELSPQLVLRKSVKATKADELRQPYATR